MKTGHGNPVRRAAVLGAGVMGAQIAAHFANAGIPVVLFEMAVDGDDRSAGARQAVSRLAKLKPAPLADPTAQRLMTPANYDDDLALLADCDLVIEAITERLDLKHALYGRIAPHIGACALLASNTSGIPIRDLAAGVPGALAARFCGVHFFNPPRYMHLVELIPHAGTDAAALDELEGFLTRWFGKGVIRAKDTPNFIANRIGVFSMLATMYHADRLGLPLDVVDRLTGPGIGHPKSATFRTADVVGLDTFRHVVDTLATTLPDDPWASCYRLPDWLNRLIEDGQLGQKTGGGIYRKEGREIHVLQPDAMTWRRVTSSLDDRVRKILKEPDPARKFEGLLAIDHPQAEFLLALFQDLFHYCAVNLADIADTARDVDLALRWGFGWKPGPFETWQAAGWDAVTEKLRIAIDNGETLADAPLPDWVAVVGERGIHDARGSWSAGKAEWLPRRPHPVYRRQVFPERVAGEPAARTSTLWENDGVRLWSNDDDIGVLGFRTYMHTVDAAVLDGIMQAIEIAEQQLAGLVLWQSEAPFCAGANLKMVLGELSAGNRDGIRDIVHRFQLATSALRYARVPVVAGVEGLALGGGCELLMHCDHVVAALESYIGLVEVGVGIIPAAGGTKEMALRAAQQAGDAAVFALVARHFETIAWGKVSGSAVEARTLGFLRQSDTIVMHPREVLHVACRHAIALSESGYRPPQPPATLPVAGRDGIASLCARMVNLREGGFISAHDYRIGAALASVICGGDTDPGSAVDEDWLLRLELDRFMELLDTPESQARMEHMMKQGKALRN